MVPLMMQLVSHDSSAGTNGIMTEEAMFQLIVVSVT